MVINTYCSSKTCQNKCGKKMPPPEALKDILICSVPFCNEYGEVI